MFNLIRIFLSDANVCLLQLRWEPLTDVAIINIIVGHHQRYFGVMSFRCVHSQAGVHRDGILRTNSTILKVSCTPTTNEYSLIWKHNWQNTYSELDWTLVSWLALLLQSCI